MTLIRPIEAACVAAVWMLYASVDWIADSVVSAVCPMLMICV